MPEMPPLNVAKRWGDMVGETFLIINKNMCKQRKQRGRGGTSGCLLHWLLSWVLLFQAAHIYAYERPPNVLYTVAVDSVSSVIPPDSAVIEDSIVSPSELKRNSTTAVAIRDTFQHVLISGTHNAPKPMRLIVRKAFKQNFTFVGLGLITNGFMVKLHKNGFREIRESFYPEYKRTWDDYTQYIPLATTWALHTAGVKGKSNIKRLFISNAMSAALMAVFVNSMKYSIREMRPDKSSRNSFPSGHSATAFMAATILHKEYGLTRSPWYSVGAYAIAGATGVGRILNNRHWISDVLTGAGIGVFATEMGYFLTDVILRGKGIRMETRSLSYVEGKDKPHFLGLTVAATLNAKNFKTSFITPSFIATNFQQPTFLLQGQPYALRLKSKVGTTVSVDGAYFLNRNMGIGGQISATILPVSTMFEGSLDKETSKYVRFSDEVSPYFGMVDISAGVFFSHPLGKKIQLGGKLLLGSRFSSHYALDAVVDVKQLWNQHKVLIANDRGGSKSSHSKELLLNKMQAWVEKGQEWSTRVLNVKARYTSVYTTAFTFRWNYRPGMSLNAQLSYSYAAPLYRFERFRKTISLLDGGIEEAKDVFQSREYMHQLGLGLGMAWTI